MSTAFDTLPVLRHVGAGAECARGRRAQPWSECALLQKGGRSRWPLMNLPISRGQESSTPVAFKDMAVEIRADAKKVRRFALRRSSRCDARRTASVWSCRS